MPIILATWKAEMRRMEVLSQSGENSRDHPPISNITGAKWTGDVLKK
jgi:hypothetical protein